MSFNDDPIRSHIFFKIGIHSMQGPTATLRYGVTNKSIALIALI